MFLRKYWIPTSVFIVAIAGIGLYLLATQPPKDRIVIHKPIEPIEKPTQQPTPQAPMDDTSQGGHVHADGTWHEGPHEAPQAEVSEPVEKPPYIYNPDAKERPDGWNPDLVFHTGDGKSIDLNYRPLTEEEQAEYDHLKATLVPPEDYGVTEAGLRITAIGNIQRKNAPAFLESIEADIIVGKPREEIDAKLRTFSDIFAD